MAPTVDVSVTWADAQRAAAVLAVQPQALGGAVLRAGAGPVRDAWINLLRSLLPANTPMRRMPLHVQDERLLGGLDLSASLQAGRAVAQQGLLAEADGGIIVLAMADRVNAATAARLAAVLDTGEVVVAREGVTLLHPSRIGVLALDEGDADERPPAALTDRLAIWLDLSSISPRALTACDVTPPDAAEVLQAQRLLPVVQIPDAVSSALCAAALAMGIVSMRAPLLAIRLARALAALDQRPEVDEHDAALAARWVLGPRARVMPVAEAPPDQSPEEAADPSSPAASDPGPKAADATPAEEAEPAETAAPPSLPSPPSPPEKPESADESQPAQPTTQAALEDTVLAAARATMPAHLLESLAPHGTDRTPPTASTGAGQSRTQVHRGAPVGTRRGDPRSGQRLNLLATLRAAAPWQALRAQAEVQAQVQTQTQVQTKAQAQASQPAAKGAARRILIRPEDFRVTRFRQRGQTTVIFVVDASGSAALHRLAEAKGAVELLLADCYSRRDHVAVLAFRGASAELLMPPTRSLVRARRSLAGLPGGGGTPLASAIDAATLLAAQVRRNGQTPLTVLLTDGRANIARDGSPGRERAEAQALHAAQGLRASRSAAMLLDTSPRPHPQARRLADEMGALYMALPQADAAGVNAAVRAAKLASQSDGASRRPGARGAGAA